MINKLSNVAKIQNKLAQFIMTNNNIQKKQKRNPKQTY